MSDNCEWREGMRPTVFYMFHNIHLILQTVSIFVTHVIYTPSFIYFSLPFFPQRIFHFLRSRRVHERLCGTMLMSSWASRHVVTSILSMVVVSILVSQGARLTRSLLSCDGWLGLFIQSIKILWSKCMTMPFFSFQSI
jgi:hypothetical protein